ncbi:hypothetical protein [Streptomyces sp. NPDC057623]|uniref:hypothetical protein n=1 Tax=Streptomyces sp. NPDC057623 TaxID=3346187 RepID=UPI0036BBF1D8
MYAIHLEADSCQLDRSQINFGELAHVIPRVSGCRVEHMCAAELPHSRHMGVVFVSADSIVAAGAAVLQAVRYLLKDSGSRARPELRAPAVGGQHGLCHGVVSVRAG